MANEAVGQERPKVSPLNDPAVRGYVFQALLLAVLVLLIIGATINTSENMRTRGIPTDFRFWNNVAGFDIGETLIPYSALDTYGRAFWVGLLNTLLVSAIGIVLATFLGFIVGVARLSRNLVINKLAMAYVELIRNTPLLLQLLFWYNAMLKPLPVPRQSIAWPGGIYLNNRGIIFPNPQYGPQAGWVFMMFFVGVAAAILYATWAHRRQIRTGEQAPVSLVSLALIVGLPAVAFFVLGQPISLNFPVLKGFNFVGGFQVYPEFVALVLGLVIYTVAFIAEIVRAGIMAVSRGQTEAAHALGLRAGPTLNLVVIPQALRVIIPPLTSQYLNLTKNSSLAVFVGYPDLVQVFAGTVLNQTGAAVQVMAITMLVYLTISLVTSALMNWYNARKALVER
ncbi:MAG: amino acid ABC transporter permease [Methylobacteriaceae bacterium]|nr:amino acid ABC transporter permease [Methylobacteriaceae bacterium]